MRNLGERSERKKIGEDIREQVSAIQPHSQPWRKNESVIKVINIKNKLKEKVRYT